MKFLSTTHPALFVFVIRDSDRGDFWRLIQLLSIIGLWFWQHRLVFSRAARVIVAVGDVTNAVLETCAVVYDIWVYLWQPVNVLGKLKMWPGTVGIG